MSFQNVDWKRAGIVDAVRKQERQREYAEAAIKELKADLKNNAGLSERAKHLIQTQIDRLMLVRSDALSESAEIKAQLEVVA